MRRAPQAGGSWWLVLIEVLIEAAVFVAYVDIGSRLFSRNTTPPRPDPGSRQGIVVPLEPRQMRRDPGRQRSA